MNTLSDRCMPSGGGVVVGWRPLRIGSRTQHHCDFPIGSVYEGAPIIRWVSALQENWPNRPSIYLKSAALGDINISINISDWCYWYLGNSMPPSSLGFLLQCLILAICL